jgi:hypothetical protein
MPGNVYNFLANLMNFAFSGGKQGFFQAAFTACYVVIWYVCIALHKTLQIQKIQAFINPLSRSRVKINDGHGVYSHITTEQLG